MGDVPKKCRVVQHPGTIELVIYGRMYKTRTSRKDLDPVPPNEFSPFALLYLLGWPSASRGRSKGRALKMRTRATRLPEAKKREERAPSLPLSQWHRYRPFFLFKRRLLSSQAFRSYTPHFHQRDNKVRIARKTHSRVLSTDSTTMMRFVSVPFTKYALSRLFFLSPATQREQRNR